MNKTSARPAQEPAATPWWKVGMVWLVLGGPAVVVVAALVTAGIAIHGADTLVYEPVVQAPVTTPSGQTPAIQARNHAATAAR